MLQQQHVPGYPFELVHRLSLERANEAFRELLKKGDQTPVPPALWDELLRGPDVITQARAKLRNTTQGHEQWKQFLGMVFGISRENLSELGAADKNIDTYADIMEDPDSYSQEERAAAQKFLEKVISLLA
jgi:hypothetical protein